MVVCIADWQEVAIRFHLSAFAVFPSATKQKNKAMSLVCRKLSNIFTILLLIKTKKISKQNQKATITSNKGIKCIER